VVRTRVGYSGGTTQSPTYHSIGDHSETIQIDYDPEHISYRDLLDIFWKSHDPGNSSRSLQYRTVIFYHNEQQRRFALESLKKEQAKRKGLIYTEILPFTGFTLAEEYHQKFRLQQETDLVAEFDAIYPSKKDFISSTAVSRVNGFLGGYGSPEVLKRELDSYGLSASSEKRLLELLSASRTVFNSCPL